MITVFRRFCLPFFCSLRILFPTLAFFQKQGIAVLRLGQPLFGGEPQIFARRGGLPVLQDGHSAFEQRFGVLPLPRLGFPAAKAVAFLFDRVSVRGAPGRKVVTRRGGLLILDRAANFALPGAHARRFTSGFFQIAP